MWPEEVKRAYVTGSVPDEVIKKISRQGNFHKTFLEYPEGYNPRIHGQFNMFRNYSVSKLISVQHSTKASLLFPFV